MIKLALDNVQIGNTVILAFGSETYMTLDIPYYIRQVLREQRMVYVPGIGMFRLNQTSAKFSDDKKNISPPSLNISFDDSKSDNNSLLKYILDTGLLTEDKAQNKLEKFTQSAINSLLDVDAFTIDGVGTISKKAGIDTVQFEPNVSELTREFSDLISIKLTPISRIAEQKAMAMDLVENKPDERSMFFWPRIILLTLLLLALWFFGKHIYDNHYNPPDENEIGLIEEETLEDDGTTLDSNEIELQKKYAEIDKIIDPQNDTSKSEVGENKSEEVSNDLTEEASNDLTENVESKQEEEQPINKYAELIPESGECIIIVGSYIKSLNAIKMVSRLERKGYKVYQSEYKGFTRVGLKYECIDADLEVYLQEIRKKITKKAWYLEPDLEIPYLE